MVVNCISELVGIEEELGPVLEKTVLNSVDRLQAILQMAATQGERARDGDIRHQALALQNLIIGRSVLSKVIGSESELFSVAEQTLKALAPLAE